MATKIFKVSETEHFRFLVPRVAIPKTVTRMLFGWRTVFLVLCKR